MLTVLELIKRTTDFLAQRGLASPRLNAELLVGHALSLGRMQLYLQFERVLTEAELELLRPMVRRRGRHEPVQYIIGRTDFCGLQLKVDPRALIPRPETEQLVEHVVQSWAGRTAPRQILDLGTGTGAIALALATRFPEAQVTAAEVRPDTLELARENAEATQLTARVAFVASDWFAAFDPALRFDLIVSNPPYLSEPELAGAAPEVRDFEPREALVGGGEGGIGDLCRIIDAASGRLEPAGLLALETGPAQHAELRARAEAAGFRDVRSLRDLAGRDRFVLARP